MGANLRWGFMGTGWIARVVAQDFAHAGLTISAIGSSGSARAAEFASDFGILRSHGSYEDVAADPDVDIVYVTLLNQAHLEGALLAIERGKHVLVEKPFTMTSAEAERLVSAARSAGVFAMEALWSRFTPSQRALMQALRDGVIGEPHTISAQYGEWLVDKPRVWDPESGGGALMDLGVYPLAFIMNAFGAPTAVSASATLTERHIDSSIAVNTTHTGEQLGSFVSTISAASRATASILGSHGRIEVWDSLWGQAPWDVYDRDGNLLHSYRETVVGTGRQYQALEVERCVREGLLESPLRPLEESILTMRLIEQIREQTGIRITT